MEVDHAGGEAIASSLEKASCAGSHTKPSEKAKTPFPSRLACPIIRLGEGQGRPL
jgi:hypothetical protein